MVRRIMTPYFYLQQTAYPPIDGEEPTLNNNFPPYSDQFTLGPADVDVRDNHAQLIRQLAAAGTVLLKNKNNVLPLQAPQTIGVFGNDAGDLVDGLYFSGSAFQNQYGFGKVSNIDSLFSPALTGVTDNKTRIREPPCSGWQRRRPFVISRISPRSH